MKGNETNTYTVILQSHAQMCYSNMLHSWNEFNKSQKTNERVRKAYFMTRPNSS